MTLEELQELLAQAESSEQHGRYDEAEQSALHVQSALEGMPPDSKEERNLSIINANATWILGVISFRRGEYAKSLELLDKALQKSTDIEDKQCMARVLGNMGLVYWNLSNYPNALECLTRALSMDEDLSNKTGIAANLRGIGMVHSSLSEYPEALEYFTQALSINEELGNKSGMAANHGNIGIVHTILAEYPKALEHHTKALRINKELSIKTGIAANLGNIGTVYFELSEFPKALEYYSQALSINEEIGNKSAIATNLGNIGNVYHGLSEYSKALEYFGKALFMDEELSNKSGIARHLGNIGNVYHFLADYPKALEYHAKALSINEEIGNKSGIATNLGNIGIVHRVLSNYPKALEYYTKALRMDEELGNNTGIATQLGNIGSVYLMLSDHSKAQDFLERSYRFKEELGQKSQAGLLLTTLGELYMKPDSTCRDVERAEQYLLHSIAIDKQLGTKNYYAHLNLADLYKEQERWKECTEQLIAYQELKDEVLSDEAKKSATQMEQRRLIAEREKEIAIAKAAADAQMSATTSLLYKVLPESVATRMIGGDNEIADYYPQISILFADIAGFTPLSADMPAIIVVRFLNFVFAEFDRIIKKHGCEKIKTIGDGYMAVCGAPIECSDHAERLAAAAVEMQQTIVLPESIREHLPDNTKLGIRIGLHTGSVVAGVIGEERFVYDIYSDAVNIAARMESHGEEDKIHCSNDFYRHMQNRFAMTKNTSHGLSFVKRGEMEIKGKGMMRTYFMEKA